ncbi:NmrA family transcriptional regulator [Purpureocillium lavendulum]|uniref:NmrA family transcriptional regulator n=1 Tax=Purpureocillium lavendulum TaxID=1247861 RepID=A0AB34FXM2_9HYPO|nr:NmrA family transcriptional regulator [Purpureocillium lavendulum]
MMFVICLLAWLLQLRLVQGLSPETVSLAACPETCLRDALRTSNCTAPGVACLCADDDLFAELVSCAQHGCMPKDTLAAINVTTVACDFPVRDDRPKLTQMAIAFLSVTSVIVGLRLFQRLCLGTGLYSDDWLIVVSYICGIPSTIILIVGLAGHGLGTDAWTVPFDDITRFLRFMYVNEILYFTQVFTVKLSILAFYLRLFPGTVVRRLIWATIGLTCCYIVIYDLMVVCQCKPINHYWLGWDREFPGSCLSINALVWANAASSITLDVWMLVLPLSQLKALQLHWKKKIGVALMFSVGVFVTAVSILRLQFLVKFGSSTNTTWDQFPTSYWSAVELNVSVCCACMPSMRLILVRMFPTMLGSSRDRLHESPISLSMHRRARNPTNPDPTLKIIQSRGFQGYCDLHDERSSSRELSEGDSSWTKGAP